MHTKIRYAIFIFTFIALSPQTFAKSLPMIAQFIARYIDQHKNHTDQVLAKLVSINSQTNCLPGVRSVGGYFEHELNSLGFKTFWEEMPKEMHRAGNLFAIRKGHKGKRLLLIGHLDTVFSNSIENHFQYLAPPFAKGNGVSDMKGGDIVLLQALNVLHAMDALKDTTIIVALMGDEEDIGKPHKISRATLIKLARESDIALDFESGPPSLGRRGLSTWTVETNGVQQHSSLVFQPNTGFGAAYEIVRILDDFAKHFDHVDNLTVNPSVIYGGRPLKAHEINLDSAQKLHVVAKYGYASGDFRYISTEQKNETKALMKKIVTENYPLTHASISFTDIVSPMTPTTENEKLFSQLKVANKYFSEEPLILLPPKLRGGGDISFIYQYVKAGLVGLGPNGKYEHSLDEIVDLESLHLASKRAAMFIYELTNEPNV